jgi:sugar phosphate permease
MLPLLVRNHKYATGELVDLILCFSVAYCVGQFLMGSLSDRFGPRRVIAAGMAVSAACTVAMGLSANYQELLVCQSLNGLAQSVGWSGLMKMVTKSAPRRRRGVLMGWWSTNYVLGAFLAKAIATWAVGRAWIAPEAWRRAALLPGFLLFGLAIVFFAVSREERRGTGVWTISEGRWTIRIFFETLTNPRVARLASVYFFVKLIRYSLLFWLPLYLTSFLKMAPVTAMCDSIYFEFCGIIGVLAAAYSSDYIFGQRRYPVAILAMVVVAASSLLISSLTPGMSLWLPIAAMAVLGWAMFAGDSILVGAATQDAAASDRVATVAGIVDGVGSGGQIFAPLLVGVVSSHYGWPAVFQVLAGIAILCVVLLLGARETERPAPSVMNPLFRKAA